MSERFPRIDNGYTWIDIRKWNQDARHAHRSHIPTPLTKPYLHTDIKRLYVHMLIPRLHWPLATLMLIALFATAQAQTQSPDSGEGHIALASITFTRTSDIPHVEITDFVVVPTTKKLHERQVHLSEAAYALILTDNTNQPLDTILLEDPLNPRYEYPTDQGTMEHVRIAQDVNHVLVRFPYRKEMHGLQVSRISEHQELHIVSTLILPEVKE